VQSVALDISGAETDGVLPRRMRLNLRGLTVDLDQIKGKDAAAREALKDMGYRSLQANIDYDCAIDERAQKAETTVNVDLVDMGRAHFELELGGLGPLLGMGASKSLLRFGPEGLSPEAWTALGVGALAMTVNRGALSYEDHSLTSRAVTAAARKRGISEEEARAEMSSRIEARRQVATDLAERQAIATMIGFIQKPGVIAANVRPEPAASYAELAALGMGGNYVELLKRLKLTVNNH